MILTGGILSILATAIHHSGIVLVMVVSHIPITIHITGVPSIVMAGIMVTITVVITLGFMEVITAGLDRIIHLIIVHMVITPEVTCVVEGDPQSLMVEGRDQVTFHQVGIVMYLGQPHLEEILIHHRIEILI